MLARRSAVEGCDTLWSVLETLHAIFEVAIPVGLLPVLALRHRPQGAVAWLLASLVLPVVALLAYLYFGTYRRRRRERREQRIRAPLESFLAGAAPEVEVGRTRKADRALARAVERAGQSEPGGWPVVGGNRVTVWAQTRRIVDALIEDVAAARTSVHLLFYTFDAGDTARRLSATLAHSAGRGVACRLLAGAYSSRFEGSGSLFATVAEDLRRAGVSVHPLEPVGPLRGRLRRADVRDHRKLVVVDGRIAWIGSQNILDPPPAQGGDARQLMLRIEGPAVPRLQAAFLEGWLRHELEPPDRAELGAAPSAAGSAAVQVLAWGPAAPITPPSVHAWAALLGAARERIVLSTAYFVPDEPLRIALRLAAYRGVAVDLVIPERTDKAYVDAAARTHFAELLGAGVRIHLHAEGFLHAKCLSADDAFALVGSANLDPRSLYLNYEAGALVYDRDVAVEVRRWVERWLAEARPLEHAAWRERPLLRKTTDALAGLLSPLL